MARKFYIEDDPNGYATPFWNDAEVKPGFSLIPDGPLKDRLHADRYAKLRIDGLRYVAEETAKLYIKIENSTITSTQAFLYEQHVEILLKQISGGHWLTAQNTNNTLPLMTGDGLYDQTMKDSIGNYISNYINDNY